MKGLANAIHTLSLLTKWGAILVVMFMALLITLSVLSRELLNAPVLGDYELVQLMMVAVIALGLPYAEYINSHVTIGLLVDRLSLRSQQLIDLFVHLLVFACVMFIGTIQLLSSLEEMSGMFAMKTPILSIPQYPFQFFLAIGFYFWGLERLLKFIYALIGLFDGGQPVKKG